MELKKISEGRILIEHDGFVVIKPEETSLPVPFFCPCCDQKMKNSNDSHSFVKFGVCNTCEITKGFTKS